MRRICIGLVSHIRMTNANSFSNSYLFRVQFFPQVVYYSGREAGLPVGTVSGGKGK